MYRRISLTAVTVVLLFAGISSAETPNRVTILYDSFGKAPALIACGESQNCGYVT